MLATALFSLSALANTAEPEVVETESREIEHRVQATLTGALDPRVRVSRHAEGHRWGLQASVQVYRHGQDWSPTPAPLLTDGGLWIAPRIGLLWRHSMAGDRLHFELGAAFNPIAVVEGLVLGGRTDLPVLGATFGSAIGGYHSVEYTTAFELDVTDRFSAWGGMLVSTQSMWWEGRSLFDDEALDEADSMLLLQPSVGISFRI